MNWDGMVSLTTSKSNHTNPGFFLEFHGWTFQRGLLGCFMAVATAVGALSEGSPAGYLDSGMGTIKLLANYIHCLYKFGLPPYIS